MNSRSRRRSLVCFGLLVAAGAATPPPSPPARGLLDAVADCGVANDGTTDATSALQACIDRAYAEQRALWLPAGRYLVSDTLTAAQKSWVNNDGGVNIVPARFRSNVIIGAPLRLPTPAFDRNDPMRECLFVPFCPYKKLDSVESSA